MRTFACLFLALLVGIATETGAQPLAIVGGTVIDGNGGAVIADGVVLIEGQRIVAVGGKSMAIPSGTRKIAADGKYVMPGLMDANVHLVMDFFPHTLIKYEGRYDELAIEAAQVALRSGLTTVFDSWGPRRYLVQARDAVNAGRVIAARMYIAGNIVGLGGPYSSDFLLTLREGAGEYFADRTNAIWQENVGPELTMMSPEQVRTEIRAYAQRNVDFIKYAATGHGSSEVIEFSPRVQKVIVEEAHRAGITVQTHTSSGEGVYLAAQSGVDLMQHCEITGLEPMPAETVAFIAQQRVPCAFLAYPAKALSWYREHVPTPPAALARGNRNDRYGVMASNQKALMQAGAVILLSTDAGVWSLNTRKSAWYQKRYPPEENPVVMGEGHFHWLLAAEQMGMKPMHALMAATSNIARAYKVDADLGTIEKGKIADLLILDKNPLERAANYRSISLVMKEGKIVDRGSLPTQRLLTADEELH